MNKDTSIELMDGTYCQRNEIPDFSNKEVFIPVLQKSVKLIHESEEDFMYSSTNLIGLFGYFVIYKGHVFFNNDIDEYGRNDLILYNSRESTTIFCSGNSIIWRRGNNPVIVDFERKEIISLYGEERYALDSKIPISDSYPFVHWDFQGIIDCIANEEDLAIQVTDNYERPESHTLILHSITLNSNSKNVGCIIATHDEDTELQGRLRFIKNSTVYIARLGKLYAYDLFGNQMGEVGVQQRHVCTKERKGISYKANKPLVISPIRIGNVVINSFTLDTTIERIDYFKQLHYHYSIDIQIFDNESNSIGINITPSENRRNLHRWEVTDYSKLQVFETLFTKLIPLINSYVECKLPIREIDSDSLNLHFLFDNEINEENTNYNHLRLIDDLYVKKDGDNFCLRCISRLTFADTWFICKCLKTKYKTNQTSILFPITEEQVKNYKAILYLNVVQNEINLQKEYTLIKYAAWNKYIGTDFCFYQPSDKELRICSFIVRLKGVSEHVGESRVGRDDCEYDFASIGIQVKKYENPNEELINMISKIVNHKLTFNSCSFDDWKGAFKWHEHTNHEYVAGLAGPSYDTGSAWMTYGNRIKLIKEVLRTKKNNLEIFDSWEI